MKKRITRTCIGCRKRFTKKEMVRLKTNKKNQVVIDKKNQTGRGVYICSRECLEKVFKKEVFKRAFKKKVEVDKQWLVVRINQLFSKQSLKQSPKQNAP